MSLIYNNLMELKQYIFEKYITKNNTRVFLGYKTVLALNDTEALTRAREKLEEDIFLCPIANPSNF